MKKFFINDDESTGSPRKEDAFSTAMSPITRLILLVLIAIWPYASGAEAATPIPRTKPEPPPEFLRGDVGQAYRNAFDAAKRGRLETAKSKLPAGADRLIRDLVQWTAFINGANAPFPQMRAFYESHSHWPLSHTLTIRVEEAINDSVPDADTLAWFTAHPPITGKGQLIYAQALFRAGRQSDAIGHLKAGWRTANLSSPQEQRILDRYGQYLEAQDHIARVDYLLWQRARRQASRLFSKLPDDWRALAKARSALMAFAYNVDGAVAAVPDHLKSNAGLVYDRAYWRRIKGKDHSAADLLLSATVNGTEIGRPDRWWRERHLHTRKAIKEGRIDDAYRLAADHAMLDGIDDRDTNSEGEGEGEGEGEAQELPRNTRAQIAEAEWLAGWIALRFKSDPSSAFRHFQTMYSVVGFPVSLARGAYWSARAAQDLGDQALARRWFEEAAKYPTVFYGQLALDHLGNGFSLLNNEQAQISDADRALFEAKDLVAAARILARMGDTRALNRFTRQLVLNAESEAQAALAAQLGTELEKPQIGVIAAKIGVRDGTVLVNEGYPVIALDGERTDDHSLILSIARQESQFDPKAVSHVGALGLMQLMPATANRLARQLRRPYSKQRLLSDPAYNLELGSTYFKQLMDRFDRSPILALAAYNAGAGAVNRWLDDYGDPRHVTADPIDWIELIPYGETRNYVQRVLEAATVYSLRLNTGDGEVLSDPQPISLTSFIDSGRDNGPGPLRPLPRPALN